MAVIAVYAVALDQGVRAAQTYSWCRDLSWDPWRTMCTRAIANGNEEHGRQAHVLANMALVEKLIEQLPIRRVHFIGLRVDKEWYCTDNAQSGSYRGSAVVAIGAMTLMGSPAKVAEVVLHELHHLRRGDVGWSRALDSLSLGPIIFDLLIGVFRTAAMLAFILLAVRTGLNWLAELACDRAATAGSGQDAFLTQYEDDHQGWGDSWQPSLSHPPPRIRRTLMRHLPVRPDVATRTVVTRAVSAATHAVRRHRC